jgi:hypothetical protein
MVSRRIYCELAQHTLRQRAFAVYLQHVVLPPLLLPRHKVGALSGLTAAGQTSIAKFFVD